MADRSSDLIIVTIFSAGFLPVGVGLPFFVLETLLLTGSCTFERLRDRCKYSDERNSVHRQLGERLGRSLSW